MRRSDGASRSRWNIGSAARWRVPMGTRYGHAAVGVGWLVGRLYRIVRRHHRAQTGGRIVAPEGDGAQGSAATRGHWQLAMGRGTRTKSCGRMSSFALPDSSPARPLPLPAIIRTCTRRNTGNELDAAPTRRFVPVRRTSSMSRCSATVHASGSRRAAKRSVTRTAAFPDFEALSRTSRNASSVNSRSIFSATCSTAPTIRSRSSTPRHGDSST